MAYKSKTDYQNSVIQYIRPNGNGEITGQIMQDHLIDLSDSVHWGIAQQAKAVAISTTPLVVSFAVAMPSANYALLIRAFDAQGDPVDYRITDILSTGFTVTGSVAGFIDWVATHE